MRYQLTNIFYDKPNCFSILTTTINQFLTNKKNKLKIIVIIYFDRKKCLTVINNQIQGKNPFHRRIKTEGQRDRETERQKCYR